MRRWTCTTCSSGVLAPDKPRQDDIRRYCLTCSKKTGKLVKRTCPALDKVRTARKETAKASAAAQAALRKSKKKAAAEQLDKRFTATHPITGELVDLRKELPKVWRAARKHNPRLRLNPPRLVASRGGGAYAYTGQNEIHLGHWSSWETLVHEVSHFTSRPGRDAGGRRTPHDRNFYYAMKATLERLIPGLSISFYEVTSWGYNVDGKIARQLRAHREALQEKG